MNETPGEPTTSTNVSTKPTDDTSLGRTGNSPAVSIVTQSDAMQNLVAAMVKRAVLDAHPQSPIPHDLDAENGRPAGVLWAEERLAAHAWVLELFKEKPSNLEWAQAVWRLPYKDAAMMVQDRRLDRGRDGIEFGRRRKELHNSVLEEGYISTKEAARILGLTTNGVTDRIRRGSRWAPEHRWFPCGKYQILGILRESALNLAADPRSHSDEVRAATRRANFKKRWDARRKVRDRANAKRQADRQTGEGRADVVLGGI